VEQLHPAAGLATVTLAAIILFSVLFRGFLGRISIFLGVIVGYVVAALTGQVDFTAISAAPWIGLPEFHFPAFGDPASWSLLPIFLPVILVLIAENVGHVRGVATMTGDPTINRHTGRALTADGVASTLAGLFGGSATTTYGENIGVMAATRVYSTAAYWVAGAFAILLSFSPAFGAVINTIPRGSSAAPRRPCTASSASSASRSGSTTRSTSRARSTSTRWRCRSSSRSPDSR
jgi:NCS2 family nucleobase:cation symporter-2